MRKSQLFRQMLPVLIVLILLVGSCSDKEQPVSPPASFNPEVVSVTPAPNALIGISNDTIMIEFSKPLDASTVNDSTITISPALEADFQYDSVRQTILIIPAEEMEYGRQYTVTVGLGVLDLKGLSLRKEYWWSFRTLSVASLYVVPGGSGDGSSDDPLGSIQQAIDIADSSHIQVIYVASGEYHESVVIEDGVTIYGSRDPSNAWFASEVDSTVLFGQIINGHPVAVLVQDVSATVSLRSLTIIAADATEPGEGSYGVSCVNSSDVDFRDCSIRSGNGAPGIPGEDGVRGHDAPLGEQAHGGMGGLGWHATGYWVCDSVTCYYFVCLGGAAAEPGNPGHCFDGSLTGGTGGDEGQNGEDGQDGVPGSDGEGGNGAITIVADAELVLAAVDDGGDGGEGGYGCGGGGGGGAGGTYCMPCWETGPGYPADAGGWGGGGAGPGTGGTGGRSGGCSIALLGYNSSLRLSRCRVSSGFGGDGGDAGAGGVGGAGQAGGAPVKDGICSWPAGWGGDGGDGGRGGHGGGGAGGASIAVAAFGGSSVQYSLDTEFIPGEPGKGGASDGNAGEDGVQGDVYGDGVKE